MNAARERLESDVRALCDVKDHSAASTLALRGYGPEILGFLLGSHTSETDANDAFAELCEVVWRKLPTFAWESTLRTWMYGVAQNVSRTLRRDAGRRRRREAHAAESAIDGLAASVRTETLTYLRTQTRNRLQELRDALPPEDRALLILRVDRRLEWNDLALVLAETRDGERIEGDELTREAGRLRKRFQLVKDRLRAMARREGLGRESER